MILRYARSKAQVEKTLPYLRYPLRMVEKHIEARFRLDDVLALGVSPFVGLNRTISHSDDIRQAGRQQAVIFGLFFHL